MVFLRQVLCRSDPHVGSWGCLLPPGQRMSHAGVITPTALHNGGGRMLMPPHPGAPGGADACTSPGHFPAALHAAISSHAHSPSRRSRISPASPSSSPEVQSLPGRARPQKAPPPTSGPADVRSFCSPLWPPSHTLPPVPHPALPSGAFAVCVPCSRAGFLKAEKVGTSLWHSPGVWSGTWQGLARGLKKEAPGAATSLFDLLPLPHKPAKAPGSLSRWACTSFFCHVSPRDPPFSNGPLSKLPL